MRHPTLYILVISSWACLFALSWASPVDISLPKSRPCPSPPKDASGFSDKCVPVSRPAQRIGTLKILRGQLLGRAAPSQNCKRNGIPLGSNGRKRQIMEEVPTRERDPFSFPLDIPDPTPTLFPWVPEPPRSTTPITEDPSEEPTARSATISTAIVTTDAPQTTLTPSNSVTVPTSLHSQPPTNSEQSNSDAGPIIAGCSIGGIALIAIFYLAFMAWRRSRKKKRRNELDVAPPPYTNPPMGEMEASQTGFVAREATPATSPPAQPRTANSAHASNPISPPDNVLGRNHRQEQRVSRRFYAAVSPIDTDPNDSNGHSTYTQASNYPSPFPNLPIVTEESTQERPSPADPIPPHESAAARAARQPTTYRSRRDSRDVVRRSLFGSISSNNSNSSHEHGSTDYDWQHVSYPTFTEFGRHHDVSPIEPADTDRLPFGRQMSPPLTIDSPQRRTSNIRPNSTVSVNSFENMDGPASIGTRAP